MKNSVILSVPVALAALSVQAYTTHPLLLGDLRAGQVNLYLDLNGDGDSADAGEEHVFFDGSSVGLESVSVFSIAGKSGVHYAGDGSSDTVYRLHDANKNGTANDAGEATVWFSKDNAEGRSLHTPNGMAIGNDGAVYVVEADVLSDSSGDYVYRTQDLNGDGDANDAGESSVWLDLTALNKNSSPFEISFDGDTAYIIDTVGGDDNVIYKARDVDGSGAVEANEVTTLISEGNPYGGPVDFAMTAVDGAVYALEMFNYSAAAKLFGYRDLDGSGAIDAAGEAVEVWNTDLLPKGFGFDFGFDLAHADDGTLALVSNGLNAETTGIFTLFDLNGDGDFLDEGETTVSVSGLYSTLGKPRPVDFYTGTVAPVPLPAGLPLLAGALGMAFLARRKRA